ncbi:putative polyprotein of viral origin [Nephila pilipes]|uniref:Putative polyprotein of viral origin n=1 Tax=Nephila pilipes TaxID=299642 RepID=A0A8X6P6Q4_NEPPI|nr:putative polyprotein of viral origin [Nephila pilipes]
MGWAPAEKENFKMVKMLIFLVKKGVQNFCDTSVSCQLQAKKKPSDKIPITPVTRPNEPFQIINVDVIGLIEPSSKGYKFILCAINQCTRWPEVICLKNVTAKSTCDALLQIFSRTVIPRGGRYR